MFHLGNLNLKEDELDSNHLRDQEGDQQDDYKQEIMWRDLASSIVRTATNLLKYSPIIKN